MRTNTGLFHVPRLRRGFCLCGTRRQVGGQACSMFHGGFSLVEMLFYIALLALSLVAVMQMLIAVTRSYGVLKVAHRIEQESSAALERMVREIRDASAVDDAGSVLGGHPGELLLITTNASSSSRTVEFYLENGKLALRENGIALGALTSSKTIVSRLVFRKISAANSIGVKVEMTLQAGSGIASRSEDFYATAVLRDSY